MLSEENTLHILKLQLTIARAGQNDSLRWWEDDSYDPVNIYVNSGDNVTFDKKMITSEGIYNGLVGDVDGDGDYDFMRLPGHSAKVLELWENRQF